MVIFVPWIQVAWLEANVYKREGQLRKVLTQHPQARQSCKPMGR